jgi:hypothetical protein
MVSSLHADPATAHLLHQTQPAEVPKLLDNDLGASLLFTMAFHSSMAGVPFLLAWLENPASKR